MLEGSSSSESSTENFTKMVLQMFSDIQATLKSLVETTNKLVSAHHAVVDDASKFVVRV